MSSDNCRTFSSTAVSAVGTRALRHAALKILRLVKLAELHGHTYLGETGNGVHTCRGNGWAVLKRRRDPQRNEGICEARVSEEFRGWAGPHFSSQARTAQTQGLAELAE
jgi:hypothetical protein